MCQQHFAATNAKKEQPDLQATHASESALAEATAETAKLREELEATKAASSQREAKLKKVAEQVRLLHRERDTVLKKLKTLGLEKLGTSIKLYFLKQIG